MKTLQNAQLDAVRQVRPARTVYCGPALHSGQLISRCLHPSCRTCVQCAAGPDQQLHSNKPSLSGFLTQLCCMQEVGHDER